MLKATFSPTSAASDWGLGSLCHQCTDQGHTTKEQADKWLKITCESCVFTIKDTTSKFSMSIMVERAKSTLGSWNQQWSRIGQTTGVGCSVNTNRMITATELHNDLQQINCVHVSALMIQQLTDNLVQVWEEVSTLGLCTLKTSLQRADDENDVKVVDVFSAVNDWHVGQHRHYTVVCADVFLPLPITTTVPSTGDITHPHQHARVWWYICIPSHIFNSKSKIRFLSLQWLLLHLLTVGTRG